MKFNEKLIEESETYEVNALELSIYNCKTLNKEPTTQYNYEYWTRQPQVVRDLY